MRTTSRLCGPKRRTAPAIADVLQAWAGRAPLRRAVGAIAEAARPVAVRLAQGKLQRSRAMPRAASRTAENTTWERRKPWPALL